MKNWEECGISEMDKQVLKNFLCHGSFQLVNMLLPLLTMPYLARVLGPEGLGSHTWWFSAAHYFLLFSRLGLGEYGNRTVAALRDDREALSRGFWSIYTMQFAASALSMIVYAAVFHNGGPLALAAGVQVFSGMFDIGWMFFGLEQFRFPLLRSTLVKAVAAGLIFLEVKGASDLALYSLIMAGSTLIGQLCLWTKLPKLVSFYRPGFREVAVHIRPNLLLFIPALSVSLYKVMDKLMLGTMAGTAQLGCYEASEQILNVPVTLGRSLGAVMLPRTAHRAALGRMDGGELHAGMKTALFLAFSMALGLLAIAEEFVPAFFGPGFDDCRKLLWILAPSAVFIAFSNVLRTQYLIPQCRDGLFTRSVLAGAACNLALNLLLIPRYRASGAAVGTLCAEFTVAAVQLWGIRREVKAGKLLRAGVPYLAAGLVMLCFIAGIRVGQRLWLTIAVKVAAGAAIYLALVGVYHRFARRLERQYRDFPGGALRFVHFLMLRRRWGTTREEYFCHRLWRIFSDRRAYFSGTNRYRRSWKSAKPAGLSRQALYWVDFQLSRLLCPGLDAQDYFAYGFPGMPIMKRRSFITEGSLARMDRHFNYHSPACAGQREILRRKDRFNAHFSDIIGRRWMVCNCHTTQLQIDTFCHGLDSVIRKPVDGIQGRGVEKLPASAVKSGEGEFLLEEVLCQHPALASLYPESVNTLRIYTVEYRGTIHITGATLRIGVAGITDNYTAGGIAAEVDCATGRVISDGIRKSGECCPVHPGSGAAIRGFSVPHWEKAAALVCEAHRRVLPLRYIGWDVCITDSAEAVLVEANTGAGVGLQQHPRKIGKKQVYRKLW